MSQYPQNTTEQLQAEIPVSDGKQSGVSTAIAIGINQYQFFQPLRYAEADARAVRECLAQRGVNHPQNCWLFSDTSVPLAGESTYPNRSHLLHWLNYLCQQQHQSFRRVWFFFSGYGATSDRRDYLMPIDGDPYRISATGIPVPALLGALKAIAGHRVLVILDMNRAPSIGSGHLVGIDTMKVARQLGVPTLLSSKPNQFARETSALEHGFFTQALLEAYAQDPDISLSQLYAYLRDRMRSLTNHHNVPPQDPILVAPSVALQQPVFRDLPAQGVVNGGVPLFFPERGTDTNGSNGKIASQETLSVDPSRSPEKSSRWLLPATVTHYFLVAGIAAVALLLGMLLGYTLRQEPAAVSPASNRGESEAATPTTATPTEENNAPATPTAPTNSEDKDAQHGQPTAPEPSSTAVGMQATDGETPAPETSPEVGKDNAVPDVPALESIAAVQASQFSRAIASARNLPADHPFADDASDAITRWGLTIWEIAQARAQLGDYQGAMAAAQLVPRDREQLQQQVQTSLPQWQDRYEKQQENQEIMAAAQKIPRNGQASSYIRAINKLRAIESGEPYYDQAQQLQQRWSQAIWEIASDRAEKENYQSAIQAAVLVPEEADNYETVQKAIASWREKS
ncbi:caspase family protein [Geitlerinema sp. PCC 9228]|uniref:caspase family protein n=1 Tax=Geitlerinema sp. PCC 9228 TaxID=111611 RepID=UPI0008F9C3AD|nr:caspase family protein [Geitlerinema sp. PCC 9228]